MRLTRRAETNRCVFDLEEKLQTERERARTINPPVHDQNSTVRDQCVVPRDLNVLDEMRRQSINGSNKLAFTNRCVFDLVGKLQRERDLKGEIRKEIL